MIGLGARVAAFGADAEAARTDAGDELGEARVRGGERENGGGVRILALRIASFSAGFSAARAEVPAVAAGRTREHEVGDDAAGNANVADDAGAEGRGELARRGLRRELRRVPGEVLGADRILEARQRREDAAREGREGTHELERERRGGAQLAARHLGARHGHGVHLVAGAREDRRDDARDSSTR